MRVVICPSNLVLIDAYLNNGGRNGLVLIVRIHGVAPGKSVNDLEILGMIWILTLSQAHSSTDWRQRRDKGRKLQPSLGVQDQERHDREDVD